MMQLKLFDIEPAYEIFNVSGRFTGMLQKVHKSTHFFCKNDALFRCVTTASPAYYNQQTMMATTQELYITCFKFILKTYLYIRF